MQSGGTIYSFDLATQTYGPSLQVPWFFNETFSGATWIEPGAFSLVVPEPAAGSLLLAAAGFATRRRR